MAEMLATTSAYEIKEWIVELGQLRPEDEREAMKRAEQEAER